jgi:hypothetical protein
MEAKMAKFIRDAAGQKIEVTNFDYSDTHFEGVLATGRYKGRKMLFLKARSYEVAA